jgi:hypothetical protein
LLSRKNRTVGKAVNLHFPFFSVFLCICEGRFPALPAIFTISRRFTRSLHEMHPMQSPCRRRPAQP